MLIKGLIVVLFVMCTTGLPQFKDDFLTPPFNHSPRNQWYNIPYTDHRWPPGPPPRQPHDWRSPYPSHPEHRSPLDRWPPTPPLDHRGPPGHERRPPGFDRGPSNFHDNGFPPHDRRPPPDYDHGPPGHRHHSPPNHNPPPPDHGPHQPPDYRPFPRPEHRPYPSPDYRPHTLSDYGSRPTDHRLPPPDARPSHNINHNYDLNGIIDNSHEIASHDSDFQTHDTQPIQSQIKLESLNTNKSAHIRDTNTQRDEVQQFNGQVNQEIIDDIFGKNPQTNDKPSAALAGDVNDSHVASTKPTPHKFQVIPVTPES